MARGVPKAVIDMLQTVPLFSACNKKELREVAKLGVPLTVADGTVLTEQGKPGREFFLILEGKARCTIDGVEVAEFHAGDFFGEMALLDHGPRHATVIADGPAEVLVLDGREFNELLDASPSIARKILVSLAERERLNASVHS
jgi:CRP/FNR family transcriptional regulator, cyclic AMP receptor protein